MYLILLTISFAIFYHSSQYLATTVVINRYRAARLTKVSAAIF